MSSYCPFCGTLLDPASAPAGSLPETMRCPTCNQEMDRPQDRPLEPPVFEPTLAQ